MRIVRLTTISLLFIVLSIHRLGLGLSFGFRELVNRYVYHDVCDISLFTTLLKGASGKSYLVYSPIFLFLFLSTSSVLLSKVKVFLY